MEEEDLEDLSCTDLEQQWGKLKKSTLQEFEAKPLMDLCHVKVQKDKYIQSLPEITDEMKAEWKQMLMNCKMTK